MKRSPGNKSLGYVSSKCFNSSYKSQRFAVKQSRQEGCQQHEKFSQNRCYLPSDSSSRATHPQYSSSHQNKFQCTSGMTSLLNSSISDSFQHNNSHDINQGVWKYDISPSSIVRSSGKSKLMQVSPRQIGRNIYVCDGSASPRPKTFIRKKHKRKSISSRVGCFRDWNREDALKAIALEKEYAKKERSQILLLRFPDPELSKEIVSGYSAEIESVHFQQSTAPRCCYVYLRKGSDATKVIESLSSIPFGTGFVTAQLKHTPGLSAAPIVDPEDIDPYTLYIGNLPTTISSRTVKQHFPKAHRIDIGFAQRMKHTRYAFVRYQSFEEALEGFRGSINTLIDSRSPIVRFRRQRGESKILLPPASAEQQIMVLSNTQRENFSSAAIKGGTSLSATATIANHIADEKKNLFDVMLAENCRTDSMQSPEELQNIRLESKANIRREAQCLQTNNSILATRSNVPSGRRGSVEEMFTMLDQRQTVLNSSENISANAIIKEEMFHCGGESDNEDPMSLLGARYTGVADVKTEDCWSPSPGNSGNDIFHSDSDYIDEFGTVHEEDGNESFFGILPGVPSGNDNNKLTNLPNTSCKLVNVAKEDPDDIIKEKLPIGQLNFPTHSTEMERLYEQQRKFRQREEYRRPRDELDAIFLKMDSDDEDCFL